MSNSIICLPEIYKKKINLYDGFCSDYIENFSIKFKNVYKCNYPISW